MRPAGSCLVRLYPGDSGFVQEFGCSVAERSRLSSTELSTAESGSESSAESSTEVLLQHDGPLARIILNRPKALNALTHGMISSIAAALTEWRFYSFQYFIFLNR